MIIFKQRDATDCGACCLFYIAKSNKLKQPLPYIRQIAGTAQIGTSALGLVQAAQKLNFNAKGVKGQIDHLISAPLPAIAHCLIDQKQLHYVVLVEWTPKFARVMDPAVGRVEKWSHEKFKSVWTGVLILMAPGQGFQPGDHTISPARRLWRLLQPHKRVLIQAFVGAVLSTILALATAVYIQKIVDSVIPDGNRSLLNLLGVAMLVVLGFKLVLGVFQSLLSLRTAQKIDAALILGYYRHLLQLPQQFFDTMRVGEITSRVADAVKVRNFLNSALLNLVLNPLILVFALAAMFFYSWQLALLSLALIPGNAVLYWFVNLLNRTYQRQIMERGADFDAQLVESLHAQPALRRFRLEDDANLKTEVRLVRLLKTGYRAAIASLGCGTAGTLLTSAYQIGLLWLGTGLVLDTQLTPGQLMSCYTLAGYLTGPLTALIGLNTSIQEALIATDRLFEIIDLELEKNTGTIEFNPAHARDLRFDGVSFRHAGRLATLTDISLTLPAGRITVLAGESGCGKSTLLALLQRLYLPEKGRVYFGDIDAQYFTLDSLRRHLAVVPQATVLLSGTVLENLAPGDPAPDLEKILRLCREVGVLEFIEQLPQKFLTHLSENGANLSGGQRQRLALVRALYLDAPVLLLDEPTAALDAASERTVLALLQKLRDQGRTIIIAAHHTAVLAIADQVVRMAGGMVTGVEPGAEGNRKQVVATGVATPAAASKREFDRAGGLTATIAAA
jgi:ATP-binding cassette subfamily B protein